MFDEERLHLIDRIRLSIARLNPDNRRDSDDIEYDSSDEDIII